MQWWKYSTFGLFNMVLTSHVWLLSTQNVSVTKELNFKFYLILIATSIWLGATILFSADLEVGEQAQSKHVPWPHRLLVLSRGSRLYFPNMAKLTYLSHPKCSSYNGIDIPLYQEVGSVFSLVRGSWLPEPRKYGENDVTSKTKLQKRHSFWFLPSPWATLPLPPPPATHTHSFTHT